MTPKTSVTNFSRFAAALFIFPICIAFTDLWGWHTGNDVLTSILPEWPKMQVVTAIAILTTAFTGLIVTFSRFSTATSWVRGPRRHSVILGLSSASIFLAVAPFVHPVLFHEENFFTPEDGAPSIGTAVVILLLALSGGLHSFFDNNSGLKRRLAAKLHSFCFGFTLTALLGFLVKAPALYFYWPELSSGMAIHTSLSFLSITLGYVIFFYGYNHDENEYPIRRSAKVIVLFCMIVGLYLQIGIESAQLRAVVDSNKEAREGLAALVGKVQQSQERLEAAHDELEKAVNSGNFSDVSDKLGLWKRQQDSVFDLLEEALGRDVREEIETLSVE